MTLDDDKSTSSVDAANAFVPEFVADYNGRFAKAPKNPFNAHRALLPNEVLEEISSPGKKRAS
jgi:hypothetical protein